MKRFNLWIYLIIILCLVINLNSKDIVVTAEGEARGIGLNAKEKALENALRNSVEKGFGVFIDSTTLMENAQLISDDVIAETRGFVRSYDIVEERTEGDFHFTKIRAVVSLDKIWESDSLNLLLKRMGAPRFLIFSNEKIEGENFKGNPALQKMTEVLVNRGFYLVETSKSADAEMWRNDSNLTNNKNAITAAKDIGVEIIVLLNTKGTFEKRSVLYGKEITYFNAICEVKTVQTDSNQVISTSIGKAVRGAENPEEAIHDAFSFSALDASEELIKGILTAWAKYLNLGRPIEVEIKNISASQLPRLVEYLKTLAGVSGVIQRTYADRTGFLEIKSKQKCMYLAESIENTNLSGFKIEVNDFSTSKIRLTINRL